MRPDTVREYARRERERQIAAERVRQALAARRTERERIDAALLTGSEPWDRYLQQLHEWSQKDQEELDQIESEERSGSYLSAEKLSEQAHRKAVLRARIEVRHECIRLPQAILGRTES